MDDDYTAARELIWSLADRGITPRVYRVAANAIRIHQRGKRRVVFRPYELLTGEDTAALREYWPFVEYLILNGEV